MASRPMAKPAGTTPVVSAEEQAKIDADKVAEAEAAKKAAEVAEAEKAAEVAKAAETAEAAKATQPNAKPEPKKSKARIETFERTRPNGDKVVVKRNIDTGEQSVSKK